MKRAGVEHLIPGGKNSRFRSAGPSVDKGEHLGVPSASGSPIRGPNLQQPSPSRSRTAPASTRDGLVGLGAPETASDSTRQWRSRLLHCRDQGGGDAAAPRPCPPSAERGGSTAPCGMGSGETPGPPKSPPPIAPGASDPAIHPCGSRPPPRPSPSPPSLRACACRGLNPPGESIVLVAFLSFSRFCFFFTAGSAFPRGL